MTVGTGPFADSKLATPIGIEGAKRNLLARLDGVMGVVLALVAGVAVVSVMFLIGYAAAPDSEPAPAEPIFYPVTLADLLEQERIVTVRGEPCEVIVGSDRDSVLIECAVLP